MLRNAPYNPRRITEDARRKLKRNLERVGLLEPIIWNKRTGHVVGGHQRLKCLDALEGSPDYLVPVAVVDLDEVTERAQNVFLNNGEAQGDWDLLLLADCFKGLPDPDLTGFDRGDLYQLFGCDPCTTTVAPDVPRDTPSPAAADEPATDPQEWDRRDSQGNQREAAAFLHVVVHGSDEEARDFEKTLGLPVKKYIDGRQLLTILKGDAGDRS